MRVRYFLPVLLAALALPFLKNRTRAVPFAPEFDLVIRQGRVIDGSGNPWYLADVGIRDGRIVAVGYFDERAHGALSMPRDSSSRQVSSTCIRMSRVPLRKFQRQTTFFSME